MLRAAPSAARNALEIEVASKACAITSCHVDLTGDDASERSRESQQEREWARRSRMASSAIAGAEYLGSHQLPV
jgi:hypothetical protein